MARAMLSHDDRIDSKSHLIITSHHFQCFVGTLYDRPLIYGIIQRVASTVAPSLGAQKDDNQTVWTHFSV